MNIMSKDQKLGSERVGMKVGGVGQVRLGKKCRTDEVSSDRERAVVGTKDGRKDVKEEE